MIRATCLLFLLPTHEGPRLGLTRCCSSCAPRPRPGHPLHLKSLLQPTYWLWFCRSSALVEYLSSDTFLGTPASSGQVTKGLQSQFREIRPAFGPTLKLVLYWKGILVLLGGMRSEGKAVWVALFLRLPNIRHSLRAVPEKLRGT